MSYKYDDGSINVLKGAERVRNKPAVMLGSDGVEGAFHAFTEIVSNSLDEARAGYGKTIKVKRYADNSISVRDYGRGVPMGWNEAQGRYNWDLVFNELYAGGKYGNEESYGYTLGTNGLGSAITQYTSKYFIVRSVRGGLCSEMIFESGYPVGELEVYTTGEADGTFIRWLPDDSVFSSINFTVSMFKDYIESQAHLNRVTFTFEDEISGNGFTIEGKGIEGYLRSSVKSDITWVYETIDKSRVEYKGVQYPLEVEIILAMTPDVCIGKMFHNTGRMTGGSHYRGYEAGLSEFFKSIGSNVPILPIDYQKGISCVVSSFLNANVTSFYGQTKSMVSNVEIEGVIANKVVEILTRFYYSKQEEVVAFVDTVIANAELRVQIAEQAKQARKVKSAMKTVVVEKFVDCRSRDANKRELFILEGDSALGATKLARDGEFQALLPVKGKPINCLKAELSTVLENQEIKDIISTLGCGIEVEGGNFSLDNLRYDKIIFCTDADVDGFQIRALLYAVFYKLMPTLLREGYVYLVESPLYEFVTQKGSFFAYSEDEKETVQKELASQGLVIKKINRSKGLGENDPDMLWETTMSPETRRLVRLDIDSEDENVQVLTEMLLGKVAGGRKEFILNSIDGLGEDTLD